MRVESLAGLASTMTELIDVGGEFFAELVGRDALDLRRVRGNLGLINHTV